MIINFDKLDNFQKLCVLYSIPLKQLDANRKPIGLASGCLLEFKGILWLLSVLHAMDKGDWGLEIRFDPKVKQTAMLFPLKGFWKLKSINIKTLEIQDIDFVYRKMGEKEKIHLPPKYQEITIDRKIIKEINRKIFKTDLSTKPTPRNKYGFAGLTKARYINKATLVQEYTIETEIIFDREEDDYYIFKLLKQHPGHEFYKGCSGAPIIDLDGNLISLVIKGDISKNEIYGINLHRFKVGLEAAILEEMKS